MHPGELSNQIEHVQRQWASYSLPEALKEAAINLFLECQASSGKAAAIRHALSEYRVRGMLHFPFEVALQRPGTIDD